MTTVQIDDHLADCPTCFGVSRNVSSLHSVLQNEALRYSPPADLERKLHLLISQASDSERDSIPPRSRYHWIAWASAALALVLATIGGLLRIPAKEEPLLAELSANHVRSLMGDHLLDVVSTDQHTVKPWFTGKLDFAPNVPNLAEAGFPLLGGRLDFLAQRPVAAVVYSRDKHYINLFIWPSNDSRALPMTASERNGYHVVRWSTNEMAYAAISDLNERDLLEFTTKWSRK